MAKDRQPSETQASPLPKSYSERRKMKKVQVERHRRERINRSMGALRDLLCQGRPEMAADIDRAQILELAVTVIRHYQHKQPIMHPAPSSTSASYRSSGYSSATTAINTHLDGACVDAGLRSRLLNHLAAYQDIRYNMTSSSPEPRVVPTMTSSPEPRVIPTMTSSPEPRVIPTMTSSPEPRVIPTGSFHPVPTSTTTLRDVTHKTGPLFVDCGGARGDDVVSSRDISRDERMEEDSPRRENSPQGLVVDENNNSDMWRPW